jgi:hypothetical protein
MPTLVEGHGALEVLDDDGDVVHAQDADLLREGYCGTVTRRGGACWLLHAAARGAGERALAFAFVMLSVSEAARRRGVFGGVSGEGVRGHLTATRGRANERRDGVSVQPARALC